MLTLDLNLASRPFKNDTLPWVGLGLAVVVLILLTIWNVRSYRQNSNWVADLQQQYSTTREELAQFDRRERGAQKDIETYDLGALNVRADKANEVIFWKAFSWTRLFNLLQEVLPHDVQMISIRPIFRPQGADEGRHDGLAGRVPVSVEGVAKSLTAFLSFERALLGHENFDRVEPEGHTQSRTGSLAFELKFLYDYESGIAGTPEPEIEQLAGAAGDGEAAGDAVLDGRSEETTGETPAAAELAGAARPEVLSRDDSSSDPDSAAADPVSQPQPQPQPQPETNADAPSADDADATDPAVVKVDVPKRPTPPNPRRRGKRPRRVADKEGDQ